MHIYASAYLCISMHIYVYLYMSVHSHAYLCISTHIYAYLCISMHIWLFFALNYLVPPRRYLLPGPLSGILCIELLGTTQTVLVASPCVLQTAWLALAAFTELQGTTNLAQKQRVRELKTWRPAGGCGDQGGPYPMGGEGGGTAEPGTWHIYTYIYIYIYIYIYTYVYKYRKPI